MIEAFRDDIGDWRVVLHSPYGAKVHSPLALVLAQNLRDRLGIDPQVMHADDGIVIRLPDYVHALDPVDNAAGDPAGDPAGDVRSSGSDFGGPLGGTAEGEHVLTQVVESLDIDTVGLEQTVQDEVSGSALFAARFRECAGRSLLLPRRRPDRRSPLWQQRQRANALLQVAADYPDFPIVLETMRECLHDVYDLSGLSSLLERIHSGDVSVTTVTTDHPSPFARSCCSATSQPLCMKAMPPWRSVALKPSRLTPSSSQTCSAPRNFVAFSTLTPSPRSRMRCPFRLPTPEPVPWRTPLIF